MADESTVDLSPAAPAAARPPRKGKPVPKGHIVDGINQITGKPDRRSAKGRALLDKITLEQAGRTPEESKEIAMAMQWLRGKSPLLQNRDPETQRRVRLALLGTIEQGKKAEEINQETGEAVALERRAVNAGLLSAIEAQNLIAQAKNADVNTPEGRQLLETLEQNGIAPREAIALLQSRRAADAAEAATQRATDAAVAAATNIGAINTGLQGINDGVAGVVAGVGDANNQLARITANTGLTGEDLRRGFTALAGGQRTVSDQLTDVVRGVGTTNDQLGRVVANTGQVGEDVRRGFTAMANGQRTTNETLGRVADGVGVTNNNLRMVNSGLTDILGETNLSRRDMREGFANMTREGAARGAMLGTLNDNMLVGFDNVTGAVDDLYDRFPQPVAQAVSVNGNTAGPNAAPQVADAVADQGRDAAAAAGVPPPRAGNTKKDFFHNAMLNNRLYSALPTIYRALNTQGNKIGLTDAEFVNEAVALARAGQLRQIEDLMDSFDEAIERMNAGRGQVRNAPKNLYRADIDKKLGRPLQKRRGAAAAAAAAAPAAAAPGLLDRAAAALFGRAGADQGGEGFETGRKKAPARKGKGAAKLSAEHKQYLLDAIDAAEAAGDPMVGADLLAQAEGIIPAAAIDEAFAVLRQMM